MIYLEIETEKGKTRLSRTENEAYIKTVPVGNVKHIQYEPGDATKYDFYVIDLEYRYLVVSDYSINYPTCVDTYYLDDVVYAVKKLSEQYPKCNLYTLWAVVDVISKIEGLK